MNDRAERDKYLKQQVGYEPIAKGPHYCRMCVHFQFGHPPTCEIVKGLISWKSWCEKFKEREGH